MQRPGSGGSPGRAGPAGAGTAASLIEPYRRLAADAFDIVLESDPDGVLTFVSSSVTTHLGWSAEDLVATRWRDLIHPDDRKAIATGQVGLRSERTAAVDARVRHRDGSYRRFRSIVHVVVDPAGRETGRIAGWHMLDREAAAPASADDRAELGGPLVGAMPGHSEEDE